MNRPSRQELDALIRQTTLAVRTALDNVAELKAFTDTITDPEFTEAGGGYEYTVTELANWRSAIAALAQLRDVANAGRTVLVADDFFVFAKRVWGVNLSRR